MCLTYAIPDIHGRADLLDRALATINAHSAGRRAFVVTLGDYIDRGPDSRRVIERLIQWPFPQLQLVALKGNHEAMMWEAFANLNEPDDWLRHGGHQTLKSYGVQHLATCWKSALPEAHLTWMAHLPTLYADRYRVFVHAGLDRAVALDRQNERVLLWKRYSNESEEAYGALHIVHGHDANDRAPIVTRGRTNLDGRAWKTGRLVIGVFDDEKHGPAIEYLEVNGPVSD